MNEFLKNKNSDDQKAKIKKAIILAIILILLGIIIAVIITKLSQKNNNINEQIKTTFNDDQYIAVKKDGKYGYINNNGKMIIDPQYEYATDLRGDYALVAKETGSVYDEVEYTFIDKNGNVKLEKTGTLGNVHFIEEFNTWLINDELYDINLKALLDEGTIIYGYSILDDPLYFGWVNKESKLAGIVTPDGKITYETNINNDESYIDVDLFRIKIMIKLLSIIY